MVRAAKTARKCGVVGKKMIGCNVPKTIGFADNCARICALQYFPNMAALDYHTLL